MRRSKNKVYSASCTFIARDLSLANSNVRTASASGMTSVSSGVDGLVGANAAGEGERRVAYVGCHNLAGAGVACHQDRQRTDWPGAGHQHPAAEQRPSLARRVQADRKRFGKRRHL